MHEFRQPLRRKGKLRAASDTFRNHRTSGNMIGVLDQFSGDQKAAIYAANHFLPLSISPNKSSSGEKGRRIRPTLTVGISNTLCRFADAVS